MVQCMVVSHGGTFLSSTKYSFKKFHVIVFVHIELNVKVLQLVYIHCIIIHCIIILIYLYYIIQFMYVYINCVIIVLVQILVVINFGDWGPNLAFKNVGKF